MEQIILVAHLLIALAIIGLIMLQQGKGAEMGASFGSGGSQTLFGSSGSGNVLTKATAWLVALFFVTSFSMALLVNKRSVVVDELDLAIPAAVEAKAATVEEELPALDNTPPAVTAPAEEDLPSID
jgi:preprotein translocase subunit SecG